MEDMYKTLEHKLTHLEEVVGDIRAWQLEGPRNPFEGYVPKSGVRGAHLSAATLHKLEKDGDLPLYTIKGKRYYKKKDLARLFERVDKGKPKTI